MKCLLAIAIIVASICSPAFAQQGSPRMYPGTDFPGNDLYNTGSSSPDDCAARCMGDGRCQAFTFSISQGRCYLKWAASRFDGSTSAVSGVIESRPVVPPQGPGNVQPGYYPPPGGVAVMPSRCSARGNDTCSGCSISCPADEQALCKEGEVHQTDSFPAVCWTKSSCTCSGTSAPASPYTPGPGGGSNPNTCSQPDRFGCHGCSASCGPGESPVCSPSIPGEGNTCHSPAFCRCVR